MLIHCLSQSSPSFIADDTLACGGAKIHPAHDLDERWVQSEKCSK